MQVTAISPDCALEAKPVRASAAARAEVNKVCVNIALITSRLSRACKQGTCGPGEKSVCGAADAVNCLLFVQLVIFLSDKPNKQAATLRKRNQFGPTCGIDFARALCLLWRGQVVKAGQTDVPPSKDVIIDH